jgi:hypothetical protein
MGRRRPQLLADKIAPLTAILPDTTVTETRSRDFR